MFFAVSGNTWREGRAHSGDGVAPRQMVKRGGPCGERISPARADEGRVDRGETDRQDCAPARWTGSMCAKGGQILCMRVARQPPWSHITGETKSHIMGEAKSVRDENLSDVGDAKCPPSSVQPAGGDPGLLDETGAVSLSRRAMQKTPRSMWPVQRAPRLSWPMSHGARIPQAVLCRDDMAAVAGQDVLPNGDTGFRGRCPRAKAERSVGL